MQGTKQELRKGKLALLNKKLGPVDQLYNFRGN
jgi:hypothetical protein